MATQQRGAVPGRGTVPDRPPAPSRPGGRDHFGVTVRRTRRGRWRYTITTIGIGLLETGMSGWRSYRTSARAWRAAQDRVDRMWEREAPTIEREQRRTLRPTGTEQP